MTRPGTTIAPTTSDEPGKYFSIWNRNKKYHSGPSGRILIGMIGRRAQLGPQMNRRRGAARFDADEGRQHDQTQAPRTAPPGRRRHL